MKIFHTADVHLKKNEEKRLEIFDGLLRKAAEIGEKSGLKFMYIGNVLGEGFEDTRCSKCGSLLMRRFGFSSDIIGVRDGKCSTCGRSVAGVWA